jgi:lipoate-protein ligase A
VLHHVTMSYDMDAAKMLDILRIGREKLDDKGHVSAAKRVDPIRSQTGMSREAVIEAMLGHFEASYGLSAVPIDEQTVDEASTLAAEEFESPGWTARVP